MSSYPCLEFHDTTRLTQSIAIPFLLAPPIGVLIGLYQTNIYILFAKVPNALTGFNHEVP